MSDLMTVEEAAEMTRLSPATVRWLISQNRFAPSAKIGRRRMFRRTELTAWIDAQFAKESA
jgi:excisionase family DNA binding protein